MYFLGANGNSTYAASQISGTLPPGISISNATGPELTGIPTAPGTYTFTLRMTDTANSGNFADHFFTMVVSPMQVVAPRSFNPGVNLLAPGTVGQPYSFTVKIAGGTPPYTCNESPARPLPPGLTWSSGCVLSGTPTVQGAFSVAPIITDSAANRYIDSSSAALNVSLPGQAVPLSLNEHGGSVSPQSLLTHSVGVPMFGRDLELDRYIVGGTAPFTWSVASGSALPPGTTILPGSNGTSNYFAGIPTSVGLFPFSFKVMDSAGQTYTGQVALNVPRLAVTPNYLSNGMVGTTYSVSFIASGGTAPYTFAVDPTQGMPPGLTLSASGILSGTPTSPGFFPIGVMVTDSASNSATVNLTMVVDNALGQAPGIALGPNPIQVSTMAGGTNPGPIPINVTSTSGNLPFNISVAGIPGASLSVNTGTTPATVSLSLNNSGVAAGTYVGIVDAKSDQSVNWSDAASVVLTVLSPVPVTINSSVAGSSVTVTGAGCNPGSYTTPANLTWNTSAFCTVSFGDPQLVGGAKYAFKSSLINGSSTSHANPLTLKVGSSAVAISANYTPLVTGPGAATHFSVAPGSFTATAGVPLQFTVTALDVAGNVVTGYTDPVRFTSTDGSAALPADTALTNGVGTFTASLVTSGLQTLTASDLFSPSISGTSGSITVSAPPGLQFIPVTPCRVADTRKPQGPYGAPFITGGTSRSFDIPGSPCGIPTTAQAYSFNVAVVPHNPPGTLGFLTLWPTGQAKPLVATLNSIDGRIKSNAAIVPAGSGGAVSVFATNDTDVILDINGYFVPASTAGALAFYPVTPCRVVDTRNGTLLSGPFAGAISRTVPMLSSSCGIPATAQAYSLNFVVVSTGQVGFLTAYPTGVTRPLVATVNALPPLPLVTTPVVVANAAIVPAGTGGNIDVYATNATDLVVDINGYFAPAGPGGLSLYNLPPCRALDTRNISGAGSPPFSGVFDVNVEGSGCGGTAQAQAYVVNATVVPSSFPPGLGFLTMWPHGIGRPLAATLNALDGAITNNMAIVPTTDTLVSAFATNSTHLILDMSGYFAP
jgi:hypothetical protein